MTEELKQPEMQNGKGLVEVAKKKRQIHLLDKLQKGKPLSTAEIRELEQFEGGVLPPGVVRTQAEVATALRVDKRTVERWVADGMPREPEGYYNLIDIQAWRLVKNEREGSPDEKEKTKWDIKYREYKARLAEFELKKAYGQVISRELVEAGMIARILAVKSALWALPKIAAPVVSGMDPREAEAYLRERIKEIFLQFAEREDATHDDIKNQERAQDNLEREAEGSLGSPEGDRGQPMGG
jgi:hypothetical protein